LFHSVVECREILKKKKARGVETFLERLLRSRSLLRQRSVLGSAELFNFGEE